MRTQNCSIHVSSTPATKYLKNFLPCPDCGNIQLCRVCNDVQAFRLHPQPPRNHTSKHAHTHIKQNSYTYTADKSAHSLTAQSPTLLPRTQCTHAPRHLAQVRVVQVREDVKFDHMVGENICKLSESSGNVLIWGRNEIAAEPSVWATLTFWKSQVCLSSKERSCTYHAQSIFMEPCVHARV